MCQAIMSCNKNPNLNTYIKKTAYINTKDEVNNSHWIISYEINNKRGHIEWTT